MAVHGGRTPYDEAGALTGPARVLVAEDLVATAVPGDLWDVITPKADVSGEYPAKTGWRDIGLASDAPSYVHGGTTAGLTYQQPTGELFTAVSEVTRNFTLNMAEFIKENLQLMENTSQETAVAEGAADSGESAGVKIPIGLYTDLRIVRVCMVTFRPVGSEVVDEGGGVTRPPAVALIIPRAQLAISDKTVSPDKGNPTSVSIELTAKSEPTAAAGAEHGYWFIETAGTLP